MDFGREGLMRYIVLVIGVLFANAATAGELTISQVDGGSNVTVLSASVKVNSRSSLRKTFFIINDDSAPIELEETGVETRYDDRSYEFNPKGSVVAVEDVAAFHLGFVLFDVFGDRIVGLGYTAVEDVSAEATYSFSKWASWRASESDVRDYLISVSYVSRARRTDGTIWSADLREIEAQLEELPIVVAEDTLEIE
jgi:hypothetical protein